jgi:hypothetical protein
MPKRTKQNKITWYEKGSAADAIVQLASSSWNVIKPLSDSQLLSNKLLGYNVLVFIFVSGIAITHLLVGKDGVFSLSGLFIFILSMFIAFVVSVPYVKIMTLLTNLVGDKIGTLRITNVILSTGLPLAAGGLLFNLIQLTSIALGIIVIQACFMLIGMSFVFSTVRTDDKQVNPGDLRRITGDVQFVITIVEFTLTVVLFISAVIKGQLF